MTCVRASWWASNADKMPHRLAVRWGACPPNPPGVRIDSTNHETRFRCFRTFLKADVLCPWQRGIAPRRLLVTLALFALLLGGCRPQEKAGDHDEKPAKVEKLPQEVEIARITLTETATQRLGITTARVSREKVERHRTFGGEVMIPNGKTVVVSAPVPGRIVVPPSGKMPVPGAPVAANTPILSLVPLLTPERDVLTPAEQVQTANARATLFSAHTVAAGDVQRGKAEVEAAQIALDRATKLFDDGAGTAKAVDDAQGVLAVALTTLRAAEQREQQLAKLVSDLGVSVGGDLEAEPILFVSPTSGIIRNIGVSIGQAVSQGAALFEVVDTDVMWVRVPIYADTVPQIRTDATARITGLDGRPQRELDETTVARPVVAPPSADPLGTTVDLFFEIDNSARSFRPGQRVGVELVMQDAAENLVVPAASLLYDIYGGTWVYEAVTENQFERRRVQPLFTDGERAVLATGPPPGTQVVVNGAAELYGTEFGAGK